MRNTPLEMLWTFWPTSSHLADAERREMLSSGREELFRNRDRWARTYLKKAGLLESPKRGFHRIIPRGLEVLKQNLERIDVSFLDQFAEFVEFRKMRQARPEEAQALEAMFFLARSATKPIR